MTVGRTAAQLCLFASATLLLSRVQGRTWVEVMDTSIYASAMVDPFRDAMSAFGSIEEEEEWVVPTATPTLAPIADIIDEDTSFPTTFVPTLAPTEFTCGQTEEFPVRIRMYDSWGDGWGDTTMTIVKSPGSSSNPTSGNNMYNSLLNVATYREDHRIVFDESLPDGYEAYFDICLESNVCYQVQVNGTNWQDEIKWDIRQHNYNESFTLAKGSAPVQCQFSIPDPDLGTLACEYVCEEANANEAEPSSAPSPPLRQTSEPSPSPTEGISSVPSSLQSNVPTVFETMEPTMLPTPIGDSVVLDPTELPTSPNGGSVVFDEPTLLPTSPPDDAGLDIVETPSASMPSLSPSFQPTLVETATLLPTVTAQPTITAFPTRTAFPTYDIVILGDPSEPRSGFFSDDDAYQGGSPTPSTAATTSLYPTAPTALPTEYGVNFVHLSNGHSTGPSSLVQELSSSAVLSPAQMGGIPSAAPLSSTSFGSAVLSPSEKPSSSSFGSAVLNPSQTSNVTAQVPSAPTSTNTSSFGSAALSPSQQAPSSSFGSAALSPSQTSNSTANVSSAPTSTNISSYGSAALSPSQTSNDTATVPSAPTARNSTSFGSAVLAPEQSGGVHTPSAAPMQPSSFDATGTASPSAKHSPTYYMIFGPPMAPVPTPAPTSAATTFPTVPPVPPSNPPAGETRHSSLSSFTSQADRDRIRAEYTLRHSGS